MIIRRLVATEDSTSLETVAVTGRSIPSVGELTRSIADLLEGEFADVAVQGEISGWSRASSGHTYFTLKDEQAILSGVLWRSRRLAHPIENGMRVVARGRITLYAPRGQYQLDCASIEPVGLGDLQAAFEELKRRLGAEGLFAPERKRPLPPFPRRIGIATSRTGAAIRDMITTLERRMPSVEVVLRHCLVQGASAADDIVGAIEELGREDIDLMIVGRGGGSLEDLWPFNEERVARAIAASPVPVISAVGHEVDFTIADFVADVRAATPTAAAELAVRDRSELIAVLREIERGISSRLVERVERLHERLDALLRSRGLGRPLDLLHTAAQRVDDLMHRSDRGLVASLERSRSSLKLIDAQLRALNPENVLARGYAMIERAGDGPVTRVGALVTGERITIRMHDGSRDATVAEE